MSIFGRSTERRFSMYRQDTSATTGLGSSTKPSKPAEDESPADPLTQPQQRSQSQPSSAARSFKFVFHSPTRRHTISGNPDTGADTDSATTFDTGVSQSTGSPLPSSLTSSAQMRRMERRAQKTGTPVRPLTLTLDNILATASTTTATASTSTTSVGRNDKENETPSSSMTLSELMAKQPVSKIPAVSLSSISAMTFTAQAPASKIPRRYKFVSSNTQSSAGVAAALTLDSPSNDAEKDAQPSSATSQFSFSELQSRCLLLELECHELKSNLHDSMQSSQSDEKEALLAKIANLEKEIFALITDRETVRALYADSQTAIQTLRSEMEFLRELSQQQDSEYKREKEDNAFLEHKALSLDGQLQQLAASKEQLLATIQSKNTDIQTLQNDLVLIKCGQTLAQQQTDKQLHDLTARNDTLEKLLADRETELLSAKQELHSVVEKLVASQHALQSAVANNITVASTAPAKSEDTNETALQLRQFLHTKDELIGTLDNVTNKLMLLQKIKHKTPSQLELFMQLEKSHSDIPLLIAEQDRLVHQIHLKQKRQTATCTDCGVDHHGVVSEADTTPTTTATASDSVDLTATVAQLRTQNTALQASNDELQSELVKLRVEREQWEKERQSATRSLPSTPLSTVSMLNVMHFNTPVSTTRHSKKKSIYHLLNENEMKFASVNENVAPMVNICSTVVEASASPSKLRTVANASSSSNHHRRTSYGVALRL